MLIPMLTDHATQKATNVIAAGAVASPWWFPWLEDLSEIAALSLPILGALWLIVQIGLRIWTHFKRP